MKTSMPLPPAQIESELRGLALAADWPAPLLQEVAGLVDKVRCPAGTVVFRVGEPHDRIHFIRRGRVALEMGVPARGVIRLLTLAAGDLLGWSPLLGRPEMSASAIVLEEAELLSLSAPALLALCECQPAYGFVVMRGLASALSRRLTAARLQLLDLYSNAAPDVAVATTEGA